MKYYKKASSAAEPVPALRRLCQGVATIQNLPAGLRRGVCMLIQALESEQDKSIRTLLGF